MVFLSKFGDLQKKKVFTKIQRFFSAEIRSSRFFFQPNTADLQTKKKSSPKFKGFFQQKSEIQGFVSGQNQKLKGFFWPNAGDLKKKGLHRNSNGCFRPKSEIQGFFFGRMQLISNKKKVFPEIQRVFPAEIRNSKSFCGRNQVISKK